MSVTSHVETSNPKSSATRRGLRRRLPRSATPIGSASVLGLLLIACASAERPPQEAAVPAAPVRLEFTSNLTFIKTVHLEEPHCANVPPSRRKEHGCQCPLGKECNCFYRVSRLRDGRCLLDLAYWGEAGFYQDVVPLPDGGTQEKSGIVENCFDCWMEGPVLELNTSTQACGEEILCR